jgi:hypothetical protein
MITLTYTHTHALSLSLTHTHAHTHTLSYTHTHTQTYSFSHTHTHTYTQDLTTDDMIGILCFVLSRVQPSRVPHMCAAVGLLYDISEVCGSVL